jgi:hypothetical protein
MPITIHGDGFITGLGNVSTTGDVTASNVALGNITLSQTNLLSSISANGWQRLPSGLIMQWGTVVGSSTTVTFPIAFTTACFSVVATGQDTPTVTRIAAVSSITTTSFLLSLSAFGTACWIAMGK